MTCSLLSVHSFPTSSHFRILSCSLLLVATASRALRYSRSEPWNLSPSGITSVFFNWRRQQRQLTSWILFAETSQSPNRSRWIVYRSPMRNAYEINVTQQNTDLFIMSSISHCSSTIYTSNFQPPELSLSTAKGGSRSSYSAYLKWKKLTWRKGFYQI